MRIFRQNLKYLDTTAEQIVMSSFMSILMLYQSNFGWGLEAGRGNTKFRALALSTTAAAPCLGVVAPGLGGAAAEGDHAGARLHGGSNWL